MNRLRVTLALVGALVACSSPSLAVEGHILVGTAPFTITAPGHYVVTGNLSGSAVVLQINSSDVVLDLNGFQVESTGTGSPTVFVGAAGSVTIRNGRIRGGSNNLLSLSTGHLLLEDLDTGGAQFAGVFLGPGMFVIRRSSFVGHGAEGIFAGSGSFGGTIEGNRIFDCAIGIRLSLAKDVLIQDNQIGDTTGRGIDLIQTLGGVIKGNTIRSTGAEGLHVDPDSRGVALIENAVSGGGDVGIRLEGDDSTLLTNTVTGSTLAGLLVNGSRNQIRGNVLNNNGAFGLQLTASAAGNVYRENLARGNTIGTCVAPATDDFCDDGTGNSSAADNFLPGPQ